MQTLERNAEADGHDVAHVDSLGVSYRCLQRYGVSPVLRKQGRREFGRSDTRFDGNHAPSVGDERCRRLDLRTLLVGHHDEMEWRWSAPLNDVTAEFEFHVVTINDRTDTCPLQNNRCRASRGDLECLRTSPSRLESVDLVRKPLFGVRTLDTRAETDLARPFLGEHADLRGELIRRRDN